MFIINEVKKQNNRKQNSSRQKKNSKNKKTSGLGKIDNMTEKLNLIPMGNIKYLIPLLHPHYREKIWKSQV